MTYSQAEYARPDSGPFRRAPETEFLHRIGIPGRVILLVLALGLIYGAVRATTHLLFAPTLSVEGLVLPRSPASPGDTVIVGAGVRNEGAVVGAGFAVAVLPGGIEVEGPMREVAPGDTAMLPVRIVANSGAEPVALAIYDGWRGLRHLRTWRSLSLEVAPRRFEAAWSSDGEAMVAAEGVAAGDVRTVHVPWTNPGAITEVIRAVAVVHPEHGGLPVPFEGDPVSLGAGEEGVLEVKVETWSLPPGRHRVEVHVISESGRRAGHGHRPLVLELVEP